MDNRLERRLTQLHGCCKRTVQKGARLVAWKPKHKWTGTNDHLGKKTHTHANYDHLIKLLSY